MSRSLKKGPFVDLPLLEKVEAMNLEEPSESERLSWDAIPRGRKIAADYLSGEGNLTSAIAEASIVSAARSSGSNE